MKNFNIFWVWQERGMVFVRGVDTPMHTMPTVHFFSKQLANVLSYDGYPKITNS